jgi:hypothetical protein
MRESYESIVEMKLKMKLAKSSIQSKTIILLMLDPEGNTERKTKDSQELNRR